MKSFKEFIKTKLNENMEPQILQKVNAIKNDADKLLMLPIDELQELVNGDFGIRAWEETFDKRGLPGLIDEIYESYLKVANNTTPQSNKLSMESDKKKSLIRKLIQFLNEI